MIEKPCRECNGSGGEETQEATFRIPAGIDEGQRVRLSGEGEAGYQGGEKATSTSKSVLIGTICLNGRRRPYCTLPIPFAVAALGGTVKVMTISGKRPDDSRTQRRS